MKRENEADRARERALMAAYCAAVSQKGVPRDYLQLPSYSGKYLIDGCIVDHPRNWDRPNLEPTPQDNLTTFKVVAWVECKWYRNGGKQYINPPKYLQLQQLCPQTDAKGLFIFYKDGTIGVTELITATGMPKARTTTVIAGGTPPGRAPLPDDVEPLMRIEHATAYTKYFKAPDWVRELEN